MEEISEIRKKKGEGNAGKYVGTKAGKAYAGPDKTFPIGDLKHAKAALSYAHNAANPSSIKEKVYAKYPALEERHKERSNEDQKKYAAYQSK